MINILLSQIQSIFIQTQKHYKQNLPYYKDKTCFTDLEMTLIEKQCGEKLSEDEKAFVNWVNFNPIDGVTFLNFVDNGYDFKCWGRDIFYIIKRLEEYDTLKLQLFAGYFKLKSTNQELLYKVFLDVKGDITDKKGSIYIEYGKIKENYHGEFNDVANNKRIIIADSIISFTKLYLKYLKSLPFNAPFSKKIDTLLNDPTKLFKFIKKYNFDDGEEKIEQIIKDGRCDKASALLIYWLTQPYYYTEEFYNDIKPIPYYIEEGFKNNLYKDSANKFNPRKNDIADFIEEYRMSENKKRDVPSYMLNLVI